MKIRQVTTTNLVLEALVASDDFMTLEQLKQATGRHNVGDVRIALIQLHKYNAVGFIEQGGTMYWYATGDDKRSKHIREIVPDIKRGPRPKDYKRRRKSSV